MIFGGAGADIITAGAGDDTAFGDFGYVRNTGGDRWICNTSDIATGGADTIDGGAGHDTLFGGAAGDLIDGAAGNDNLLGDGGTAVFAGLDAGHLRLVQVFSTNPLAGGDDTLRGGSGEDILIGSAGGDDLTCGRGDDIGFGDSGQVTLGGVVRPSTRFVPAAGAEFLGGDSFDTGGPLVVESTDLFTGGYDRLDGGPGNDILIGGYGDDAFIGNLGEDTMIGNYGRVIVNDNQAQSVVRLAQYQQGLIAGTMFAAYASPFESSNDVIIQVASIGGIRPGLALADQADNDEQADNSHDSGRNPARVDLRQHETRAGRDEPDGEFDLAALQARAQRHVVQPGECVSVLISRRFGDFGTAGYQQGLALFRLLNPQQQDLDLIFSGQEVFLPDRELLEEVMDGARPAPQAGPAGQAGPADQDTPATRDDAGEKAEQIPLALLAGLMGWRTAPSHRANSAAIEHQGFDNLARKHKERRFIRWHNGRMC